MKKGWSKVSTNLPQRRPLWCGAAGPVQVLGEEAANGAVAEFWCFPKSPWFSHWSHRMVWVGMALLKVFSCNPFTEQGHLHWIIWLSGVRSLVKGVDEKREIKYWGYLFANYLICLGIIANHQPNKTNKQIPAACWSRTLPWADLPLCPSSGRCPGPRPCGPS